MRPSLSTQTCQRRTGGILNKDIPVGGVFHPSLQRAGPPSISAGLNGCPAPLSVQLGVPVLGSSRPNGQFSITLVLNGGQEAIPLLLPPRSPFPSEWRVSRPGLV